MLGPVIVDLAGEELSQAEAELIQHPYVGGLIFFGRNCTSAEQVGELVRSIRAVRPELLLAIDQEGGRVQRLRSGFTRLPALQKLGRCYQHDPAQATLVVPSVAWLMAAELRSVGIDISFAPVLDADDSFSQVIGDRSFGSDPELVGKVGDLYIQGMAEAGMKATAKHFPGHGAVRADSHLALPVDERDFDTVQREDMRPFKALLSRIAAVMPAHILFKNIDACPVGCSPYWLQQVLRQQLGFSGVIFSDDLSMVGAEFAGSYSERAVAALRAGCDAVLVCNRPEKAAEVLASLQQQQWLCDGKLATMRSPAVGGAPSLAELQRTPRWKEARKHLELLEGEG